MLANTLPQRRFENMPSADKPVREHGTLRSWNDDRGFGFIAPTAGAADIFLHISELPRDGTRPTMGERLSYERGHGKDGRPQARNVVREAFGDTRHIKRVPPAQRSQAAGVGSKVIFLLLLLALGTYGYKHYAQKVAAYAKAADIPKAMDIPSAVVQPALKHEQPEWGQTAHKEEPRALKQDSVANVFTCDGRTHCSQMRSCAEATYFLQHCPGVAMDGDHDGTPCEQQWCTGADAK